MASKEVVTPPQPKVKFRLQWFCRNCWQEGSQEISAVSEPTNYAEVPEIRQSHAYMVRQFGGKCSGQIFKQKRTVKPRVMREKPPVIANLRENPITITAGGQS